jgi:hypothetical protein
MAYSGLLRARLNLFAWGVFILASAAMCGRPDWHDIR